MNSDDMTTLQQLLLRTLDIIYLHSYSANEYVT